MAHVFPGSEIKKYRSNSYTVLGAFISYGDKFILMILNEFIWPAVGASEMPVSIHMKRFCFKFPGRKRRI